MRWGDVVIFQVAGPGRVHTPVLEAGDAVALADRHGQPCGTWHPITQGMWVVAMTVPHGEGPVTRWLAKDAHGNVQWWSDLTWHPALFGGDVAKLPLHVAPSAERSGVRPPERTGPRRVEARVETPGIVGLRIAPKPGPR